MIRFGWHTLRHNHTISCQYEGLEPRHWKQQTPEPAQQQLEEENQDFVSGVVWWWCSQTTLTACCLWNGKSHPLLVPCPTLLPADKSTCVTSQRIILGIRSLQGFTPTDSDNCRNITAQGRKGQQWSTLTWTNVQWNFLLQNLSSIDLFSTNKP